MDNTTLLNLIKSERPTQNISEVLRFRLNRFGFYDAVVMMDFVGFNTVVPNTKAVLPYPLKKYDSLTKEEKDVRLKDLYNI